MKWNNIKYGTAMLFIFIALSSFAQQSISASVISSSTALLSNSNKSITGTVGEITVLGKAGSEYIGSGFYRSNGLLNNVTSVQDISEETFAIYPNPFSDKITIEPNEPFELYDITGRNVYNSESKENLAELHAGTYILQSKNIRKQVIKL